MDTRINDYVQVTPPCGGSFRGIVAEIFAGGAAGMVSVAVTDPRLSVFAIGDLVSVPGECLSSLTRLDCQRCTYRAHDDADMADHVAGNHDR